jgi:hypothetical protein
MRSGDIPEAYMLPTMAPALVPVTTLTGMPCCLSTLRMPIWAKPFDAPPPRAMATTACGFCG